ncbi:hypothetical protein WKI65_44320 [Streptomyces sp. MS1.AVA.3]|uniref:DUF6197 family protein n=1 Tax=Streptomyces decoyicus TaxID=249567 RepID=UPI0030BD00AF
MTAALLQIESSTQLLADEVEAWLKARTEAAAPASSSPASPVAVPQSGSDIAALVAVGLAEVERSERATAAAQLAARPSLMDRLTRRHLRPAEQASVHIRRAAAVLATGGWCRGELRSTSGAHCILGALLAVPAGADTTTRSHIHIRAAMADLAYAQPSEAYIERLEQDARRQGLDAAAVRRAHDIAVHNNVAAPTVGAVLELLATAAVIAERCGD